MIKIDVCVIGGGPAGLFSGYYAKSRGLNTVVIEADKQLGGRINYFLDYAIYDLPGQFGVLGRDYRDALIEQVNKSDVPIFIGELVEEIQKENDYFIVKTTKQQLQAKSIISAVGNGFMTHKTLQINNCPREVYYDVPEFDYNFNAPIAIVGHTPMAVDWAIQLKRRNQDVCLFTEKEIDLQPILMDELKHLAIPIYDFDKLDSNIFKFIYCHIGTVKKTVKISTMIIQKDNGFTNVEGYFVAGDARYEKGKLKLIHGATHDAMQAVNAATQYLNNKANYQPIVSTHEPVFKEW